MFRGNPPIVPSVRGFKSSKTGFWEGHYPPSLVRGLVSCFIAGVKDDVDFGGSDATGP